MKWKITAAVPVFNGGKYIREAINSIIEQTIYVDEIIVFDNCSSDETTDVVRMIIDNNPEKNIKLYKNEYNLGYQKNWNKCLENATSDFVLLLHADDMLKPDTIEKQLNFFQEHPELALVGGYEDIIDEYGNLIRESKPKETKIYQRDQIYEFVLNHGSYIACSSVMFNMNKIKQVGFFEENVLATDELYWPKILSKFPIAVLGESLINRRIHPGQSEYSDFKNKSEEIIAASLAQYKIADYEKRPELRKKIKRLIQEKNARNGVRIAFKVRKNPKMFIRYLLFSLKENPSIIFTKLIWREIYHTFSNLKH